MGSARAICCNKLRSVRSDGRSYFCARRVRSIRGGLDFPSACVVPLFHPRLHARRLILTLFIFLLALAPLTRPSPTRSKNACCVFCSCCCESLSLYSKEIFGLPLFCSWPLRPSRLRKEISSSLSVEIRRRTRVSSSSLNGSSPSSVIPLSSIVRALSIPVVPGLILARLSHDAVTQGNHTATQSVFYAPCVPAHEANITINGFNSDFRNAGNFNAITILTVPILPENVNTTMWFYDYNTCGEGGVGVINDNESSTETLAGFVVSVLNFSCLNSHAHEK